MNKRKVIIKSWKQMEIEYGLNESGYCIKLSPYFDLKTEKSLPETRVIELDEEFKWNCNLIPEEAILCDWIAPGTPVEVYKNGTWVEGWFYFGCHDLRGFHTVFCDDGDGCILTMTYRTVRIAEPKPIHELSAEIWSWEKTVVWSNKQNNLVTRHKLTPQKMYILFKSLGINADQKALTATSMVQEVIDVESLEYSDRNPEKEIA